MKIIITIDDSHVKKIKRVASALKKKGVDIENVLSFSGIITGEVENDQDIEALKIAGVKSVEISKKLGAV
jgi:hypothetical protein